MIGSSRESGMRVARGGILHAIRSARNRAHVERGRHGLPDHELVADIVLGQARAVEEKIDLRAFPGGVVAVRAVCVKIRARSLFERKAGVIEALPGARVGFAGALSEKVVPNNPM